MEVSLKTANHGFWLRLSFQLLLAFFSQNEDAQEDGKER